MLEEIFVEKARYPLAGHAERIRELEKHAALFDSDRAAMYEWVRSWRLSKADDDADGRLVAPLHEFITYPAPKLAARTVASFLFGETAKITSENAAAELAALLDSNHMDALNQEAAITAAAEGEIYLKLDWDQELAPTALVSAVSGAYAFPVFRFRKLDEIAFVRELGHADRDQRKVLRHVEIRQRGEIHHRLFMGSPTALGSPRDLESCAETAGFEEHVETDIDDVLVRHVPFFRTARSPHGISIYAGAEGLIEGIHSLYTQDQHDAELAKRRVAVPSSYLARDSKGRPKFDRTLDIFELSEDAAGSIGGASAPIQAIEFADSTVMGQRIAQRLDEFLLACGIAPQSAGRDTAGAAESGTARKLAQSLTLQTCATAARYFTPALRDVCRLGLEIGRKKLGAGGPDEPIVSVEIADGVPEDLVEIAARIRDLAGAGAISTQEAVRLQHPDWTDDQIDTEVERIREDVGLKLPPPMPIGGDNEGGGAA